MIALVVGMVTAFIAGLWLPPIFAALVGLLALLPAALVVDRLTARERSEEEERRRWLRILSPALPRRLERMIELMQRVEAGDLNPDSREYLEAMIALDRETIRADRNLLRSGWALIVVMILLDIWFARIGAALSLMMIIIVPTHILIAFQTGGSHSRSKERLVTSRRRLANSEETLRIIEARGG